jgi:hypothetical protein
MAINTGNSWPRKGFTLSRRSNSLEQYVDNRPAQASSNQPIAIGDPVSIVNGIIVPATAGQDPDQAGFGVVMNVYTTANRPFTEQTVKIIASGQPGRVDVCYDPNAEFVVRCETSVGPSNIDKNVIVTGLSANSTLGTSNAAVTIPASASVNDLFRLVRIAQYNDITGLNGFNGNGVAGQPVIVRWNRHVFDPRTAGQ